MFLGIIGLIILGIIAAALAKPKVVTEDEKKELRKKEMQERVERERQRQLNLEAEAESKAEKEKRLNLEADAKFKAEEEERLKLEEEAKSKAEEEERLKLEAEAKSEIEESDFEVAKKPLEEIIKGKIRKSRPLTMNEQPIFRRLRETLEPEYVVLSQVSFGAILWTWSHAIRNRYNRKIVDFVICDKGFNVIAVIELDDSSHKGKEERDTERDLLLNEAGITVFRYKYTPESTKILEDIKSVKL